MAIRKYDLTRVVDKPYALSRPDLFRGVGARFALRHFLIFTCFRNLGDGAISQQLAKIAYFSTQVRLTRWIRDTWDRAEPAARVV